jgi:hypothetical protein
MFPGQDSGVISVLLSCHGTSTEALTQLTLACPVCPAPFTPTGQVQVVPSGAGQQAVQGDYIMRRLGPHLAPWLDKARVEVGTGLCVWWERGGQRQAGGVTGTRRGVGRYKDRPPCIQHIWLGGDRNMQHCVQHMWLTGRCIGWCILCTCQSRASSSMVALLHL